MGMTADHMPELAKLIADGLAGDASNVANVAARTSNMRQRFDTVHFVRS